MYQLWPQGKALFEKFCDARKLTFHEHKEESDNLPFSRAKLSFGSWISLLKEM